MFSVDGIVLVVLMFLGLLLVLFHVGHNKEIEKVRVLVNGHMAKIEAELKQSQDRVARLEHLLGRAFGGGQLTPPGQERDE